MAFSDDGVLLLEGWLFCGCPPSACTQGSPEQSTLWEMTFGDIQEKTKSREVEVPVGHKNKQKTKEHKDDGSCCLKRSKGTSESWVECGNIFIQGQTRPQEL